MEPTDVSVIVPTLNAAASLKNIVDALRTQILKPSRILIVDSGSTDETVSLARNLGLELLIIEKGSFDHGHTRNLAAELAGGRVIVFFTQDCLPVNDQTLLHLTRPLQEEEIIVSYARQIADQSALPGEKYLRLANYPPENKVKSLSDLPTWGIKTYQNSNACAAYRRPEFEALGRFPAPAVCNEDMLFASRAINAGYKVSYTADALVYHTHRFSFGQIFKRYFDISASFDLEPGIISNGRAGQKGYDFFKNQLLYLKKEAQLTQLPRTIIETAARYSGFKAGANHKRLPRWLKLRLGANRVYWSKYG